MVRGRSGASPAHLDDAIDRLPSSVLFGVLPTRAPRVLVPSRSCQATGLGLITVEDFSLTGQIPMLFRPWVHRRVVRFVSHLYLLSEYCAEHARQRSPR